MSGVHRSLNCPIESRHHSPVNWGFTTSESRASQGVEKLAQFSTKDPSTNLHGAIVQSLQKPPKHST